MTPMRRIPVRPSFVRALFVSLALAVVGAPAARAQRAITEASQTITVTKGSSALIVNPSAFERYAVGEPEVAQAVVVSPTEILLNGKSVGSTTLILWDKANQPRLYSIDVAPDVAGLQRFLRDMLPAETISVQSNGKAIVLSGEVRDPTSVQRAVDAAQSSGAVVIDNLVTPPAVQVLLKVRFAEVNRSALKDLSFNWAGRNVEDIASPIPWEGNIITDGIVKFLLGDRTGDFFEAQIQAQITKGNLKSLAEPNLLTLPGKEATFLAGGEFPYPTVQGGAVGTGTPNAAIALEVKACGIKL